MAFADASGHAPFVGRKLRACAAAGIDVVPVLLPQGTTDRAARRSVREALAAQPLDGVFLEFPFPDDIDGEALSAMIPEAIDVDIMTEGRIARYFADRGAPPPLTVTAGLDLLDGYEVDIAGRPGLVVGPDIPFTRMFCEAFARRGASMGPVVAPDDPALRRRVQAAGVVVVAASEPDLLRSTDFEPGTVAVDVGYFNPGGRGDIECSGGISHLAAIAPVPGGIGPMTVSVLVERVIDFADRDLAPVGAEAALQ